jgi:hypothetical protein
MKQATLPVLAAAALLTIGAPAAARDVPAGGLSAKDIAAWLRQAGLKAEVKQHSASDYDYDQIVSSAVDGVNFDIYLFGCGAGRCNGIQYAAGWSDTPSVTDAKIIEWDRTKRYVRAYRDGSGNVWGEYDVDIAPGGSYEQLDNSLKRWRRVIGDFKTFIGQ